jgi:hypothetical protein
MADYLFSMAVSVILTSIQLATRDPGKAATLKRALLKIRDQINLLYPVE